VLGRHVDGLLEHAGVEGGRFRVCIDACDNAVQDGRACGGLQLEQCHEDRLADLGHLLGSDAVAKQEAQLDHRLLNGPRSLGHEDDGLAQCGREMRGSAARCHGRQPRRLLAMLRVLARRDDDVAQQIEALLLEALNAREAQHQGDRERCQQRGLLEVVEELAAKLLILRELRLDEQQRRCLHLELLATQWRWRHTNHLAAAAAATARNTGCCIERALIETVEGPNDSLEDVDAKAARRVLDEALDQHRHVGEWNVGEQIADAVAEVAQSQGSEWHVSQRLEHLVERFTRPLGQVDDGVQQLLAELRPAARSGAGARGIAQLDRSETLA